MIRKRRTKSEVAPTFETLGVAVAFSNDLDAQVPVLQNLAVKHVDYAVKEKDYAPVGIALVNTLKQGLGEEFTEETQLACTELVELVVSVMKQAHILNWKRLKLRLEHTTTFECTVLQMNMG